MSYRYLCLNLIFSCFVFSIFSTAIASANSTFEFKVSAKNEQTTKIITHLVEKYHYEKPKLNDKLSSEIFNAYLETLDSNRSYFLASDISDFENLRYTFDNLLNGANLAPAYAMFSVYRRRVLERITYAKTILESDFNFSIDDEYIIERKGAAWLGAAEELDELWHRRVKYDWLTLKLDGKSKEEIIEQLTNRYTTIERRVGQIKESDVFELIMNTYLSAIEPHTSFFSPRATENFKIRMSLSLEGIGAVLQSESEYTLVHRILPGGPADLSGHLQAGDRITAVGQGDNEKLVDVVGWRLDDVVDLIRGKKGSVVRLKILPKTEPIGGIQHVTRITRDKIKLEEQAASESILEIKTTNGAVKIGVITIPTFYVDFDAQSKGDKNYRSTTRDVQSLLRDLENEDIKGLIVDLRGNGGGSLIEAISATGLFIESGPIVQIRESRGRIDVRNDPDSRILYSGPLAILVDRDSASASEIFAGAIQDYRRGLIIGEPTFGKGTVQNLVALDQFSKNSSEEFGQLKVTIAQFFRVNGESTQYKGVIPDFFIPEVQYRSNRRESTNSNAMEWSKIRSIKYTPFTNTLLSESEVVWISKNQDNRVADNRNFQFLIKQAELDFELAKKISYSLMESKRNAERETRSEQIDRLKVKYLNGDSNWSDASLETTAIDEIVLTEAAYLLTDAIAARKNAE